MGRAGIAGKTNRVVCDYTCNMPKLLCDHEVKPLDKCSSTAHTIADQSVKNVRLAKDMSSKHHMVSSNVKL